MFDLLEPARSRSDTDRSINDLVSRLSIVQDLMHAFHRLEIESSPAAAAAAAAATLGSVGERQHMTRYSNNITSTQIN